MNINYNETMVSDYINGNDTLEHDLDELENDASFMRDVMKISKDKKMYDFASDEVKKDYAFIKAVIEMFKDDEDFVIEVANYYLENIYVYERDLTPNAVGNSVINISDYKQLSDEQMGKTKEELYIIMNSLIKDENKRIHLVLMF